MSMNKNWEGGIFLLQQLGETFNARKHNIYLENLRFEDTAVY